MGRSHWVPSVIAGADGSQTPVKAAVQESGDFLHAWAKFTMGGKRYVVHAKVNLREEEADALERLPPEVVSGADPEGYMLVGAWEALPNGAPGSYIGGRRSRRRAMRRRRRARLKRVGKRVGRGIKKAAKKVAQSKVVKRVVGTVRKVLDNPLVKAAMTAVPGGAAITAARGAARLAVRSAKGNRGAKKSLGRISVRACGGVPEAQEAMRLVAAGIALDMPHVARQLLAGRSEPEQWRAIAGWDESQPGAVSGYDIRPWSRAGSDAGELARELEALNEFASSGAWDGVRWMARQLAWKKMERDPAFTKRGALLDGRSAMARRFAA